jgi:UDP-N-acetylglucosamine--N-acetylmuramyl-(pentapeptide) pyrophosphoryl-undecaprenol N-acetylglucosamine transferase
MNKHASINESVKGTVLIMAGGTGGHIFPALTIARNLQLRGYRAEWLGTLRGLEVEVLRNTDITLHLINVRGLRGKGILSLVLAPFMIIAATVQSMRVLCRVRPCCVLGMGGYVTGPGGVAAKLLRYILLIHEQNAIAGFSNRCLARIADVVMETFPGTFPEPVNAIRTGNPIRADIADLALISREPPAISRSLRLLVLGGSLGATAINLLIPRTLNEMSVQERPHIWHQTGHNNLDETVNFYKIASIPLDDSCRVEAFIDDMAAAYRWADLVVCRSGATTVTEIAAAGLPSILIPYPHAVDDHQTRNAQWLSDSGAALLWQQADLNLYSLSERLRKFSDDWSELAAMSSRARQLAQLDSCDLVVNKCVEACRGEL